MALFMVAATVYGVAQLLVLSSPTRSVRISTVLLAIAVGVYGCGIATALLEYAYTRAVADQPRGGALLKAVNTASYTVDPVIEELVKVTPLLLAAWNVKIRRQWGLTDYVVIGAALGAGFGLLEAVVRFGLDADRALDHPAGGWIIPDRLFPPYIPGPDQIFSSWFPAPSSSLDLGEVHPAADTSPHLVYTAAAALGVGVLIRARGWLRGVGLVPVAAACAHHILANYSAQHPADRDTKSLVDDLDGILWAVPLACLAIAVSVDMWQIRRAKRTIPGVLLQAERAGRTGLEALVAYGLWRVPWSTLIALRFARMRRALLYAAGRAPYPGSESLHRTVAWTAGQIDATNHQHAWHGIGLRTVRQAARAIRDRRRIWGILISLVLMLPALVLLGAGSLPAAAELQDQLSTGNGPHILMGFGIAGLLWITWQLTQLLRTWQATSMIALAEAQAMVRFRIWTALGGLTTGTVLLLRMQQKGLGPDDALLRKFHLLEALNNFLAYLGFALILLSLLALFPPGGGLALAGTGAVAGTITIEAAIHAAALGTLGVVLMTAGSGSGEGSPESQGETTPAQSSGRDRVKRGKEYEDHLQETLGGRGSFRDGGREFDGAFTGDDGVEVWYEAKSGRYWELANENPKVMEKFKSNLGDARRIAEEGGRKFSLISEKPIPENIVKWLDKKNYTWRVIPKGAG
ncbi:PrsW family glutamic-type intramembrane protease [Streptomyces sp. LX-29]|uniref:PrsW family glutamic-type intramembrane protease n=1 Tax=Streptomyces sp. LX-29 TaxID=2900152 RepID=UPI00240E7AAF|nr:PrsW family glutamic-type intramembrane protease [Streptomyces sp. LX-29]WFB08202.1 PrsW family glutamic-type intramembrane protease [Streptomyces sp. LX-29]